MPCWPLPQGVPRPGACFHPSATPGLVRPLFVPEHYFSLEKSMTAHRPHWHRPSPHICSGHHGCTPALRSPAKGPALSFSCTPTETVRRAASADEEEKHMESAPWRWTTVQQTPLPYAPSRVLPRGGETVAMVL